MAANPEPFFSLRLTSQQWLEASLPTLLSVDLTGLLQGRSLVHCNFRSDNLCIDGDRMVLVDWNLACQGHPLFDTASWLPSLESEGGPSPETILPDGAPWAVLLSGYYATRAGRPIIPDTPHVREVQRNQLLAALPWVVRALDLPPLK